MPDSIRIIPDRLAAISTLGRSSHRGPDDGFCVMEAVAYVTNEPWSDHPSCACPVITAFMVGWNDGLPQDERDALLLPLIPKLVGTRGSKDLETRRSLMAADWLVRTHTPAWLRLAGLTAQAETLEALPEITAMAQIPSIRGPLDAIRKDAAAARAAAWAAAGAAAGAAARDAAWAAAGAAARDAAWAAAGAAARDAAWAAARDAAWAAAGAAARDAAWAAAGAAARAAARAKLAPTQAALQQTALALIERMITAKDAA